MRDLLALTDLKSRMSSIKICEHPSTGGLYAPFLYRSEKSP
jgi:hypothetical protein